MFIMTITIKKILIYTNKKYLTNYKLDSKNKYL